MKLVKYVLAKTGLFPKWEPRVEDVLTAADLVFEIKQVHNNRGKRYYYVIPERLDTDYLMEVSRVFRANGIVLRLHRSRHYNGWVFRVPNRKQKFMQDVIEVRKDRAKFQDVLAEYTKVRQSKPKENSK